MNKYKVDELKIGMSESFNIKITADMMDLFLKLSGDVNIIHNDKEYAKSRGFKDKVVYGMLVSSFYSTLVGVYLPGKYSLFHGIEIVFSKPVFVGDELEIYGEIIYINEAYKQIEIKSYITNQNKQKVSKAKLKVGIYE